MQRKSEIKIELKLLPPLHYLGITFTNFIFLPIRGSVKCKGSGTVGLEECILAQHLSGYTTSQLTGFVSHRYAQLTFQKNINSVPSPDFFLPRFFFFFCSSGSDEVNALVAKHLHYTRNLVPKVNEYLQVRNLYNLPAPTFHLELLKKKIPIYE